MTVSARLAPRSGSGILPPPRPRHPDGRKACSWCGEPVDPPRRSWCSDACVEEYQVRAWPQKAREAVWKRDAGVCSACGRDAGALAEAIDQIARRLNRERAHLEGSPRYVGLRRVYPDTVQIASRLATLKWQRAVVDGLNVATVAAAFGRVLNGSADLWSRWRVVAAWEADHVTPVAEGGGGCGLDGYRTLCRPCHVAATAALRRRLNAARRGQLRLEATAP